MEYDELVRLRDGSAGWRLLRADHAPLVLSVLGQVFVDDNERSVPAARLVEVLDDHLYALNERLGAGTFPRPAKAYLDEWARPEVGWLRKYYPADSDEAHFDATPAVEQALSWVRSLAPREFVGTESRLNLMVDLLRQIAFGAEEDPDVRLAELQRRRTELDAEIERVRSGRLDVMDSVAQRDRYQQFVGMARGLLADFREVEANFRQLDRELRERIAGWSGGKGELLDEMLHSRDAIGESDQGRSFHAFYDFLLSQRRQDELEDLLTHVHRLDALRASADPKLRRVHYQWLVAAERTQATVRLLSDQLRRFLDDQTIVENKRVLELVRGIEATALRLREARLPGPGSTLDALAPTVSLPMERPLYQPRSELAVDSGEIRAGESDSDLSLLFEQVYVDPARLAERVGDALSRQPQVRLVDLVHTHPIEQGLAELVGYFALSEPGFETVFDPQRSERIGWRDESGARRVATVPAVSFVRAEAGR
ncbi:hypothetical protein Athai_46460 [Actinocatenispora thailandica]|uniref:DUF3375 domain-containing protein n=1 Tax=Actinocatenispora thailandica TaxID=227318 RepID=A0A7R7HYI0_9ACTN|nr:DUF3375 domain-containing protein [Actinocatenispora thailandica]BCJ37143.1 hypothetical protein Athai_46460 [Actinocatenispora thailandica]